MEFFISNSACALPKSFRIASEFRVAKVIHCDVCGYESTKIDPLYQLDLPLIKEKPDLLSILPYLLPTLSEYFTSEICLPDKTKSEIDNIFINC